MDASPRPERELDELYRRHQGFVRTCLRGFRLAEDGLDDAVHDVFVAMLGHAGASWDRARAVRPWLFGISRNVALAQRRRFARRARLGALATPDEGAPTPDELVARAEAAKILTRFIEGLDAEKLAPFVLSEVEGLPAKEVATRLGLSVTTVRWRVRVARARLEEIAAEHSPRRLPAVIVWLWPWHSARLMPRLGWLVAVLAVSLWLGFSGARARTREPVRVATAIADASRPSEPRARSHRTAERDAPTLAFAAVTIGGRVTDLKGEPIADAHVCAALDPSQRARPDDIDPTCSRSGVDGRYHLAGIVPGLHRIGATARGFLPADHAGPARAGSLLAQAQSEYRDVDIVLRKGGLAIAGVVLDETGGVVPSALVRGQDFTRFGNGWTATAIADDEGRFELWAPRGGVAITASAVGYAIGRADATAPQTGLEVRLMPEVTLSGRVIDASGSVVPGIRVTANTDTHNAEEQHMSASTDAAGNFVLRRLRPGRYRPIAASAQHYGEAAFGVLATLDDPAESITIVVEPARALHVEIAADEALAGGCDGEWIDAVGASTHATRVVGSTAELEGLLPGAYLVRTQCHGAAVEQTVTIADADATLTLHVDASTTVAGRVTGSDTLGPFMSITVAPDGSLPKGPMMPAGSITTRADADGRFIVAIVDAGAYAVHGATISGTLLPLGTFEIAADEHIELGELAVPALGRIEGAVVDGDGKGVAAVQVVARGASGLGTSTRPDGTFELVDLLPGTYELSVRQSITPVAGAEAVEVEVLADARALVELQVPRLDGELGGTVLAAGGEPVADALVVVRAEREGLPADPRFRAVARARTDVAGRFTATGLQPGAYTLEVQLGQLAWGSQRATTGDTKVVIELAERSSLAGRVVDTQGQPLQVFVLELEGPGGSLERTVRNKDGAWQVPDLPPGDYDVRVQGLAIEDGPRCRGSVQIAVGAEPGEDGTLICA